MDLPPLHVDRALRRKMQSRRKQKRYRNRLIADNEQLKAQARDLERELERLQVSVKQQSQVQSMLLSWQDVAKALVEYRNASLETNAALKKQSQVYRDFIARMGIWAEEVFGLPTAPRTDLHTWRRVRLSADPMIRQAGIDWITRHLYHNTDIMMERYGLHAQSSICFDDIDVDVTESDGYQCIYRFQTDIPRRMQDVAAALRGNSWRFLMVGALSDIDPEIVSAGKSVFRHTLPSRDENVNLVSREFNAEEDNRVVFVGEQIEDDQALPHRDKRQRRRLLWIVLDSIPSSSQPEVTQSPINVEDVPEGSSGGSRTRLRLLFMNCHSFTSAGYLSLDDEAKLWGCDVTSLPSDEAKAKRFTTFARRLFEEYNQIGRRRFLDALNQT
ncbi:hypothetical protein Ae201684P_011769 [Aphanomyces euteiches]|uniref:BZIP domain-containing protein n=1 Tax=Aphanomyces euteiches TaxID=100861 RepID=A0A6G0WUM6_9STRA|nr:hypothetical protein Ae201684_011498 [Aphanomyces euteiches]KAH9097040.1 hypothetical protein Ae201684P_011769 [Aphanomyces euteiches]KAH9154621.1 hypothetical protein AeRB84_003313 [Aphanomyces euteiches]